MSAMILEAVTMALDAYATAQDAAADAANTLEGNLTIDTEPSTVECLCSVGGDITLTGARGAVSLPSLTELGGTLSAEAQTGLSAIELPSLVSLSGDIRLIGNGQLLNLDLSALTTATGICPPIRSGRICEAPRYGRCTIRMFACACRYSTARWCTVPTPEVP